MSQLNNKNIKNLFWTSRSGFRNRHLYLNFEIRYRSQNMDLYVQTYIFYIFYNKILHFSNELLPESSLSIVLQEMQIDPPIQIVLLDSVTNRFLGELLLPVVNLREIAADLIRSIARCLDLDVAFLIDLNMLWNLPNFAIFAWSNPTIQAYGLKRNSRFGCRN